MALASKLKLGKMMSLLLIDPGSSTRYDRDLDRSILG